MLAARHAARPCAKVRKHHPQRHANTGTFPSLPPKITNVSFPADIEPGMNITITAHATLDEAITDTKMTLTMASIFKHSFDGCAGATVKAPLDIATVYFPPMNCPLAAGPATFVRYVSLSKAMPKGDTTSKLQSTDQNGKPGLCCAITLSNA